MPISGKPQRKQPVQSRSKATCAAVCEATVQVLLSHGADRLTTTRVAKRAGVSVGTLYQYYPDKQALVQDVRNQYFARMGAAVTRVFEDNPNASAPEKIDQSIDALIRVKADNLALSQALAALPADPSQSDFKAQVVEHFSTQLADLLGAGDKPVDPRIRAAIAAVDGLLHYCALHETNWLQQPWLARMAKTTLQDALRDMS